MEKEPSLLIVDDDESNLFSLTYLLNENNYSKVYEASDGNKALEILDSHSVDCILLDIHMPGMDGFEICKKIKANDRTRDIPVIFLTARYKDTESIIKGFEVGGEDFLTKPINNAELIAKIKVMTKLKRNIDELKKERDITQSVVENANAMFIVVNNDLRIINLNSQTEQVLGKKRDEIRGMNFFEFLYPDESYRSDVASTYELVIGNHIRFSELETNIKNAKGDDIVVRWSISFSYDNDDNLIDIVNIGHDITETSRLQNTIELLAADLKLKNLELDQKNLELSVKNEELMELNKMKDNLLHIASHDLRSPLNGILGYTQLLLGQQRKYLNDKQIRMVQKIQSCGELQLNLINDLLDIARLESGKLELHLSKANLVDVIKSCIDLLESLSLNKDIDIIFHKNLDKVLVTIDVPKITQVINNLLSNAIKFTPEDGKIEVSLFAKDNLVEVSVKDSGIGIAKEDLPKIFKKFTQLRKFGTEGEQGTGLGLAISKNLVELHGGIISVFSEGLGRGATFLFTLPYK